MPQFFVVVPDLMSGEIESDDLAKAVEEGVRKSKEDGENLLVLQVVGKIGVNPTFVPEKA